METTTFVYLIHLGCALFLTGLIWFVQVVHYPMFFNVGSAGFRACETKHVQRTSRVVLVPMLLELITGMILLVSRPPWVPLSMAITSCLALALIWISTMFIQVQHRRLSRGCQEKVLRSLIRSNWIRTSLWSSRSMLLLLLVVPAAHL